MVLEEALNAILCQSVAFDEIIIIEDGSNDESASIIKNNIFQLPNINLVENDHNLGINRSIMRGIELVSSEYFYIASSSDNFSTQIVSEFHRLYKKFPSAKMISGSIEIKEDNKQIRQTLPFGANSCFQPSETIEKFEKRVFSFFGGGNILHTQSVI